MAEPVESTEIDLRTLIGHSIIRTSRKLREPFTSKKLEENAIFLVDVSPYGHIVTVKTDSSRGSRQKIYPPCWNDGNWEVTSNDNCSNYGDAYEYYLNKEKYKCPDLDWSRMSNTYHMHGFIIRSEPCTNFKGPNELMNRVWFIKESYDDSMVLISLKVDNSINGRSEYEVLTKTVNGNYHDDFWIHPPQYMYIELIELYSRATHNY